MADQFATTLLEVINVYLWVAGVALGYLLLWTLSNRVYKSNLKYVAQEFVRRSHVDTNLAQEIMHARAAIESGDIKEKELFDIFALYLADPTTHKFIDDAAGRRVGSQDETYHRVLSIQLLGERGQIHNDADTARWLNELITKEAKYSGAWRMFLFDAFWLVRGKKFFERSFAHFVLGMSHTNDREIEERFSKKKVRVSQ